MLTTTVAAAIATLNTVQNQNRDFTTEEIQEAAARKFAQIFGGSQWVEEYQAQGHEGKISRVTEVIIVKNAYDQTYIPFC